MMRFAHWSRRERLGWLALAGIWAGTVVWAAGGELVGDEWVHWSQIHRFLQGDTRIYSEYLTNVPGFHWLVTALLAPWGIQSPGAARGVTALFTAAAVVLVYRIRRQLHPADAQITAAQFFFLPTMFVYGFLVYTDVPALALLLGALLATLREHHRAAAALLLASMAVRQNQVLWVVFLAVLAAWPILCDGAESLRQRRLPTRAWLAAVLERTWPYLAVFGVFCAYWAINGSIAYSAAQSRYSHPDFHPDIGNLVFLLATVALLMPFHVAGGWRHALEGPASRWMQAAGLAVVVLVAYALWFRVQHPSNLVLGNMRNQLLATVAAGGWAWWGLGLLAAIAGGGLCCSPLVTGRYRLWLPFSLVFVGASWLIETRYTMIPLTLFLLFRHPQAVWQERLTLAFWCLLALGFGWLAFEYQRLP